MATFGGPRSPDDPGRYIPDAVRSFVVARDGGMCQYCGDLEAESIDHLMPWAQGGTHDVDNLVVCCGVCNSIAGLRVFSELAAKRAYVQRRRQELGYDRIRSAYLRLNLRLPFRIE